MLSLESQRRVFQICFCFVLNRISMSPSMSLRCDWLPERGRWSYLARSGLPAVPIKKRVFLGRDFTIRSVSMAMIISRLFFFFNFRKHTLSAV